MPRSRELSPHGKQPVVVLYGALSPGASEADQDTLVQSRCVSEALRSLDYPVEIVSMGLRLDTLKERLLALQPRLVFNLVESVGGSDALLPLAPLLLESLGIPYTGATLSALVASSNKLEAKRIMERWGIPAPELWVPGRDPKALRTAQQWIVKAVWEQASFGMDDAAVVSDPAAVPALLRQRESCLGGLWFAERFIPGREFNLSLLEGKTGVTVLPPAEICFTGYPQGKPQIVGYAAKWDPASPEYKGTLRSFDFAAQDAPLLEHLAGLSRACWEAFGMRGYARVDFRVDAQGQPWVLEINGNPCLSPDAGFVAAAARSGLKYPQLIQRIVQTEGNVRRPVASPERGVVHSVIAPPLLAQPAAHDGERLLQQSAVG